MQLSLHASLDFQTSGILTVLISESARVSDFSLHVIFAVKWYRICDLTVVIIDKTLSGFNFCRHKNSVPSTLIVILCRQGYHQSKTKNKDGWGKFGFIF